MTSCAWFLEEPALKTADRRADYKCEPEEFSCSHCRMPRVLPLTARAQGRYAHTSPKDRWLTASFKAIWGILAFSSASPSHCLYTGSPFQLLLVLLLPGLGLHLLHLNGVRLPASYVQFMVAHAELQDPLVNSQTRGIKHKVLGKTAHSFSGTADCRHHPATNPTAAQTSTGNGMSQQDPHGYLKPNFCWLYNPLQVHMELINYFSRKSTF